MKIACVQMVSGPDVQQNLNEAGDWIALAASQGAKLVILPEYFCLMGHSERDKLQIAEDEGSGPMQQFLSGCARQHGVALVAGTLPLKSDSPDRVYNASLFIDEHGHTLARYDKIHLFCFKTDTEAYDEGRVLKAGKTPTALEWQGLRIGLSVCYDLRFPELYRAMSPLDLIVVPAAFTWTTGKAHWELLLRARAVENQCYVAGCGQGGLHENGRRTWGQSIFIDPWGTILDQRAEGAGLVMTELNTDTLKEIRTRLPALTHRVL